MYYYLVAPGSQRYRGDEPLTYSSQQELARGDVVTVPLGKFSSLGFVVAETAKPTFSTKPITSTHPITAPLPQPLIATWEWMRQYYPGPISAHTQLLLPPSLPPSAASLPLAKPQVDTHYFTNRPLTPSQSAAHAQIQPSGTHLVHGETGSGKTRLYIESVRESLEQGKSSIILTPEISLTSQLANSLRQAFGNDGVIVIHSQLTPAARRTLWLSIQSAAHPLVVIGPRSALFMPLKDVGLIVLDESHEYAYKQESAPYYLANRVAGVLGNHHGARVILGSATPPLTDYQLALEKARPIIRMEQPALESVHDTAVSLVDMRDPQNRHKGHFSKQLVASLKHALDDGEQSLVFINRRGSARLVLCEKCGWQAQCPRCDIALTYHEDEFRLRCHTCGYHENVPVSCPTCKNVDILMKSVGTKAIVNTLQSLFPEARIARFDTDNKVGERFHERYAEITNNEIDIIVGTQLIAKGLDLPKLTTVGILNTDTGLNIPDFSANERTYQVLHQLMGRVGRGHARGHAILQTYNPEHPIISAATRRDWDGYYDFETHERKMYHFPPYTYLLKASCRRASSASAEKQANQVARAIHDLALPLQIDGPTPAFREKVNGKYVWQIVLRSTHRSHLLKAISALPKDWSYDIDPVNLL